MKIKFLVSIIVLFCGLQNTRAQTEKQIVNIRTEVAAINKSAARYAKTTKDIEGVSLEGTQTTFYVSGEKLKKISAKIYGETFNASAEFYYHGEELIFAFQKINRYDTQIGLEKPPKIARVEESRLYFSGGKMIRLLNGKIPVKSSDIRFTEKEYEIVELSGQLKSAFNR